MFRPRAALVAVLVGAALSVGASCGGARRDLPSSAAPTVEPVERIERIQGVDTSDLTAAERRAWQDLVNEELSPCGDPTSVGQCAVAGRGCRRCVPAARYLKRLVAEGFDREQIHGAYALRYAPDRRVELPVAGAPTRGALSAAVTLVEFSDFQCPRCGDAHPLLARIVREFDGRVRWVFLHYPLDQHQRAVDAARAAVAASNQGKFWEMADALFARQAELDAPETIRALATELGLDMARFDRDVAAPETQARLDVDRSAGRAVEIPGTPTIFVNGRRYEDRLDALPDYIAEELDD